MAATAARVVVCLEYADTHSQTHPPTHTHGGDGGHARSHAQELESFATAVVVTEKVDDVDIKAQQVPTRERQSFSPVPH